MIAQPLTPNVVTHKLFHILRYTEVVEALEKATKSLLADTSTVPTNQGIAVELSNSMTAELRLLGIQTTRCGIFYSAGPVEIHPASDQYTVLLSGQGHFILKSGESLVIDKDPNFIPKGTPHQPSPSSIPMIVVAFHTQAEIETRLSENF